MSVLLSSEGVSKSIRGRPVLSDISYAVEPREIVLLLGANGVGKSTLLRVQAGLLRADKGSTKYRDTPVRCGAVGYLGHALSLYGELSVLENLKIFKALLRSSVTLQDELSYWGLETRSAYPIDELSKGLQVRAALARVFLSASTVFLLDEPSNALDDEGVRLLEKRIEAYAERCGFVIATHDIARFERCATRVILLKEGKILSDSKRDGATPSEIIGRYRNENR